MIQCNITNIRIRDEIKYLHSKKQLNQQFYQLHLYLAHTWPYILRTLEEKLQSGTRIKYKTLSRKLEKLSHTQTLTPQEKHMFHPRVVNNTDISFSNSEMSLLQKGPKYNIHAKKKRWIQNRALEAETTITQLPTGEREAYRKIVADRTPQQNNNPYATHDPHPETRLVNSIKNKLQKNNATQVKDTLFSYSPQSSTNLKYRISFTGITS